MIALLAFVLAFVPVPNVHPTIAVPSPPPQRTRPYELTHPFSLEIDGVMLPAVQSVGPFSQLNIIDSWTGKGWDPKNKQVITGRVKWGPVTLKRGLTTNNALFEWRQNIINGMVDRRTITIGTATLGGRPVHFVLGRCWPVHWEGVALIGRGPGHASDSIDFDCETVLIK